MHHYILPATQRLSSTWSIVPGRKSGGRTHFISKFGIPKLYAAHVSPQISTVLVDNGKRAIRRVFSTNVPKLPLPRTRSLLHTPFDKREIRGGTAHGLTNFSGSSLLALGYDGTLNIPGRAVEAKVAEMQALVSKYAVDFPTHTPHGNPQPLGGEVVFVTGTTGALGANLLAQLLVDPEVARVYAVNRLQKDGAKLRTKQLHALTERGLHPSLIYSPKLVLVEADTTIRGLGISKNLFHEIRSSITLIVHNAWPVHFKRDLSTFEPVIQGLRNLIDLVLESPREKPPRMIFTSSAGVFWNYDVSQIIPEAAVDAHTAVGSGYTESKWVGERILDICAETTPLSPIIVRVGQLSGGLNGAWNTKEWFPSLVRSSQALGCLGMREEDISWLPVHHAASALIEAWNSPTRYLTLTHPHPVPWDTVFTPLSAGLGATLVPYHMWIEALQKSGDAVHKPTLRLLDFYRASSALGIGLARLNTMNAQGMSPTLASLSPLTQGDVNRWVSYWKKIRFIR